MRSPACLLATGLLLAASPAEAWTGGTAYVDTARPPPDTQTRTFSSSSDAVRAGGTLFVTHFRNYQVTLPFSTTPLLIGVDFPQPLGVRFFPEPTPAFQIKAPSGTPIPALAGFSVVHFPVGTSNIVRTTAVASNVQGHMLAIDHPLANGRPGARLQVQQLGVLGAQPDNPHNVGVFYNPAIGRWAIFNQDLAPMPIGIQFDVMVSSDGNGTIVTTTPTLARGPGVFVPFVPRQISTTPYEKPSLGLIVTQNWSPSSVYNNHPIGIRCTVDPNGVPTEIQVYNEDGAAMPMGASFNVDWAPPGTQLATAPAPEAPKKQPWKK